MRSHLTTALLLPVTFLLVYCSDEDKALSPATPPSGEKVEVGPASKPIVDLTEVPAGAGWIKVCSRYDRGHSQEDKVEQCYTLDYFADEDNPDGRSLSRTNSDATGADGWEFTASNTELCWYRYGADAPAIASSIITAKGDQETCINYNARIVREETERREAERRAREEPFTAADRTCPPYHQAGYSILTVTKTTVALTCPRDEEGRIVDPGCTEETKANVDEEWTYHGSTQPSAAEASDGECTITNGRYPEPGGPGTLQEGTLKCWSYRETTHEDCGGTNSQGQAQGSRYKQGAWWSRICGEDGVDSDTGRCVDTSRKCGSPQAVLVSDEIVDGKRVQRFRGSEHGLEDDCSWNCNTYPAICPVGHQQTRYYSPRKYHKSWNDPNNPNVDTITIRAATGQRSSTYGQGISDHPTKKSGLKFAYDWHCRESYGDATDESGVVYEQRGSGIRGGEGGEATARGRCNQNPIRMVDGTTKANPTRTQPAGWRTGVAYERGHVITHGSAYYKASRTHTSGQATPANMVPKHTATENGNPGATGSTAWIWSGHKVTHKFGVPYPKGPGHHKDPPACFQVHRHQDVRRKLRRRISDSIRDCSSPSRVGRTRYEILGSLSERGYRCLHREA